MTESFEYSESVRENLIYHYTTMDDVEARLHEDNWKKWEVEAAALRAKQSAERTAKLQAASAAAATASSADQTPGIAPPPHMRRTVDQAGNPESGSSKSPVQGAPEPPKEADA